MITRLGLCVLLFAGLLQAQGIPLPNNTDIPDLGTRSYCVGKPKVCFQGGLYQSGSNVMPSDHSAVGTGLAAKVVPINRKIGMISIGMSNASLEFGNFIQTYISGNRSVNRDLVVVNAASGGPGPCDFTVARGLAGPVCNDTFNQNAYDYIRDNFLTPGGLSESQVEVIWYKFAVPIPVGGWIQPPPPLPAPNSNAYIYEGFIGGTMRAIKARYKNIKMVFLSSRIYGGYNQASKSPEPYAYEGGFSTQFAINAQIVQADQGGSVDRVAGNLAYTVAPWMAWGPYIWSNGEVPNKYNGVYWCAGLLSPARPCDAIEDDYQTDLLHPNSVGAAKVAEQLWNFFSTSEFTQSWFLANK